MIKKSPKFWLYLSLPLIFLLGFLCLDEGHNWDDDFALYLAQSQAILKGDLWALFAQNKYAMQHSGDTTGPYLYPNGFPLLLSPVVALLGINWVVLKSYIFLFFVASLPLLFSIFKSLGLTPKTALILSLLIGFNYHFIRFADWIYADIPFLFFSCLSFWLVLQKPSTFLDLGRLGFCFFLSYSIRDIGLVFLPFWLAYLYQNKKQASPRYWLPLVVFLVGLIITKWSLPNGGQNHLELLQNISWNSIQINALLYYRLIGNFFLIYRPIPPFFQYLISGIFSILILLGVYQSKNQYPLFIFLGFYVAICLLWPSFQGMRLLFAILPFLLFLLRQGLYFLWSKRAIYFLYFLLIISLAQTAITVRYYYLKNSNEVATKEMQNIYHFIQKKLPKNAIIVFKKPRTLRFFSNRNAVQIQSSKAGFRLQKIKNKSQNNILLQTANYQLIDLKQKKS